MPFQTCPGGGAVLRPECPGFLGSKFWFVKVQILSKLRSFSFSDGSEVFVFRASLKPTCVGSQNKACSNFAE